MATIGLLLIALGAWMLYFGLHGSPLLPIQPSGTTLAPVGGAATK